MKKQFFSCLLIGFVFFLVGVPVFARGQQGAVQAAGVYQRDPNLNAPGTFPINKQTVALRIGVESNPMVEDFETNWITQEIEQKGNYDLSFELYPGGEMRQKLELMVMAGGTDLPDILWGSFDLATLTKYGQAGMVIPTNVYYQNSAYYINEAKKDLSIVPEKYVTSYDGNIYGMYSQQESLNSQYASGRAMMYGPWLTKLGLALPQTIDEFANVLRAFRDRDPNGNGQKDEIPLVTFNTMMGENYLYTLMMPFIYTQPNFWMLTNGKIDVAFNKAAWRDGIRYSRMLMTEGLLSPLSFTQDNTQMTALITPDPPRVGTFVRISSSNLGAQDRKRSEYDIVPPLEGPGGKHQLWMPILPTIRMIITKNCKTPESAFMLGDFMGTDRMSIDTSYGEKGVDWFDPLPGEKSYMPGQPPMLRWTIVWGTLQNKHNGGHGPVLRGMKWAFPDVATDSPYDYIIPIGKGLPAAIQYATKTPISGLVYNDAEQTVMNDNHATILSYVQESFARFVMGDLDIERDWDAYLAEFSKMGLDAVISATQAAYERQNQ